MKKIVLFVGIAACLFSFIKSSPATEITFDEFSAYDSEPPILQEEYAGFGIHFIAGPLWPDGTTYSGGTWKLTGTNGSQFLGFDGFANGVLMKFDSDIEALSFDYARGEGSRWGFVRYLLFDEREIVDKGWLRLPSQVDTWNTFSFSGENIDGVILAVHYGCPGYAWGIDNLVFVPASDDPIPIPPTALLLGSGMIGLIGITRRKFRE